MSVDSLVRYTCAACGRKTLDYPIYGNGVSDPERARKYQEWCDYCGRSCIHCGRMTGRKVACESCASKGAARSAS
jgi:hypothetical protein